MLAPGLFIQKLGLQTQCDTRPATKPGVQDCKTSFVLDWVKATTALPV